jgi:hypothetical protein
MVVLFFIFYGTAMRHNALFAAIPLLGWLVGSLIPQKTSVVLVPCTLVLWGGLLATIHFVNYDFLGAVHLYPLQERFYADIFHLNARAKNFVLPPNSFGNNFDDITEQIFRENFDSQILFLYHAFKEVALKVPLHNAGFAHGVVVIRSPNVSGRDQTNNPVDRPGFTARHEAFPAFPSRPRSPDGTVPLRILDESVVRNQFPKDYSVLRKAWMDRILQDPVTYIKFKTRFFVQFCREHNFYFVRLSHSLYWGKISPISLLPLLFLIAISPMFTQHALGLRTFPSVMLAWSALLYILPLWMFLPDTEPRRYTLWFFAASFIAIVHFCSQSPLFHEIVQTIHRYLEQRTAPKPPSPT